MTAPTPLAACRSSCSMGEAKELASFPDPETNGRVESQNNGGQMRKRIKRKMCMRGGGWVGRLTYVCVAREGMDRWVSQCIHNARLSLVRQNGQVLVLWKSGGVHISDLNAFCLFCLLHGPSPTVYLKLSGYYKEANFTAVSCSKSKVDGVREHYSAYYAIIFIIGWPIL